MTMSQRELRTAIEAYRTELPPGRARDTLQSVVENWVRDRLPLKTPERDTTARDVASTILAGLGPYLDAVITDEAVRLARMVLADTPTPEADILRAASQILAKYRGGLATTLAVLDETADYLHSQGL